MDKGVLYLRLSKEDIDKRHNDDESESIVNQRLLLTHYAADHGIQIVDIYADDDYSGLYDNRPEFDRLIGDGKQGKFNVVIAKSQSRFTRNMEHMEKYLHHDFPLLGIRFIGVVDGVDTNVKGNKKARQIYGLTNEWYCEDLSENIRSVFRQKMKNGEFLGGFAPYGYLKSPEDKHQFVVDKEAAKVVCRIYDLYLQGFSTKNICFILEDEGVPNPSTHKKLQGLNYANAKTSEFSDRYQLWSQTTVNRILINETYIGTLIQGVYEKLSYKDKKVVPVPKERWIVVKNHHASIIDPDIFWKVRRMRESRRIVAANASNNKKPHVFAGKIKCAACGSTMTKSGGVRGKKDDWYMRCQLAGNSRLKACSSHNILFSTIEKAVLENIQRFVFPILQEEKEEIANYIQKLGAPNKVIEEKKTQMEEVQKQADGQLEGIRLLYMDRVKGTITDEMFLHLREHFEQERKRLESKSQRIGKEIETLTLEQQSAKCGEQRIEDYCDYLKLTHEMVTDFVDYIEIYERNRETNNQKITIHWNF